MGLFNMLKNVTMSPEERQERELLKRAENGDAEAQFLVGQKFDQHENYADAEKWWLRAISNGHLQAQYNLALNYIGGACGGPQYYDQGVKYIEDLADKGYVVGYKVLGDICCNFDNMRNPLRKQYYNLRKAEECYRMVVTSNDDLWLLPAYNLGHIYAGSYLRTIQEVEDDLVDPMRAAYIFYLAGVDLEGEDNQHVYIELFNEVVKNANLNITNAMLMSWNDDYRNRRFSM